MRRSLLLRALEAALLATAVLLVWALVGEGLVVRAGGKKILSVTDIHRPLWCFWVLLALRLALGVRRGRPGKAVPLWMLRLALLFGFLFFSLTLGETAARVFRSDDRSAGEKLQSGRISAAGPLRPNAEMELQGVPVKVNEEGFRGPSFPVVKPAGQYRILAVGDSYTFGNKVEQDSTWPAQLERILARETGRDVLVVNGGKWGLNTAQEVEFAEKWVPRYDPDFVILAYVPNDVETIEPIHPADRNLHEKSYLYRFVREKILQIEYVVEKRKREDFTDENPGWPRSKEALARFRDLAVLHRFRPLVVMFPYILSWSPVDYEVRDILAETIPRIGLPHLDLLPVYEEHGDPASLQAEPTDNHPNAEGYALAARAIAERLYADGVLERKGRE